MPPIPQKEKLSGQIAAIMRGRVGIGGVSYMDKVTNIDCVFIIKSHALEIQKYFVEKGESPIQGKIFHSEGFPYCMRGWPRIGNDV